MHCRIQFRHHGSPIFNMVFNRVEGQGFKHLKFTFIELSKLKMIIKNVKPIILDNTDEIAALLHQDEVLRSSYQ